MAINLQEIFDSDSELQKIDKINYNFDQILSQGGGPQGSQGVPGTAATVSERWDSDDSGLGYNILRPLNFSTSINSARSRIILGDIETDLSNAAGNIGDAGMPTYNPNALLSIVSGNLTGDIENHIEFKNTAAGSATYVLRNEGTRFLLTSTTGTSGAEFNIEVPTKVSIDTSEINLEANTTNLTLTAVNNFQADADSVEINATNQIEIIGDNGVQISGAGNSSSVNVQALGTNSKIELESATGDIILTTTDGATVWLQDGGVGDLKSTAGSLDFDFNDSSIIKATNLNTISSGQKVSLDVGGSPKFFVEPSLNTSTQTIFFEGDGIGARWKEGAGQTQGYLAAPNYGSTDESRTLSDYFVKHLTGGIRGFFEDTNDNPNNNDLGGNHPEDEAEHATIDNLTNITTNSLSYIKIGNMLKVWGSIVGEAPNTWVSNNNDLILKIEDNTDFPYKSGIYDASNQTYTAGVTMVDVSIGSDAIDINNWNAAPANLSAGSDLYGIYGLIYPGSSRIHLMWKVVEKVGSEYKLTNVPVKVSDLGDTGSGNKVGFNISFNMITSRKSYNRTQGLITIDADFDAGFGGTLLYEPSELTSYNCAISGTPEDWAIDNSSLNTLHLQSVGAEWEYSQSQPDIHDLDFYLDGLATGNNENITGSNPNYGGTKIIKAIRNVNHAGNTNPNIGQDITDKIYFNVQNNASVDTFVEVQFPWYNLDWSWNQIGTTSLGAHGTSFLTSFNLIALPAGESNITYNSGNEIEVEVEFGTRAGTLGVGYISDNTNFYLDTPINIDLGIKKNGTSVDVSEIECTSVTTYHKGSGITSIYSYNPYGTNVYKTTSPNPISIQANSTQIASWIGSTFEKCDGNTLENTVKIGFIPGMKLNSNEKDSVVEVNWKHTFDSSLTGKIKFKYKRDPLVLTMQSLNPGYDDDGRPTTIEQGNTYSNIAQHVYTGAANQVYPIPVTVNNYVTNAYFEVKSDWGWEFDFTLATGGGALPAWINFIRVDGQNVVNGNTSNQTGVTEVIRVNVQSSNWMSNACPSTTNGISNSSGFNYYNTNDVYTYDLHVKSLDPVINANFPNHRKVVQIRIQNNHVGPFPDCSNKST